FLRNPADFAKVRDWLDIRMPTFQFTDEELESLVRYFKKRDKAEGLFETLNVKVTPEEVAAAQTLMGPNNFNCTSCHIMGGQRPEGGITVWAPDLANAHNRIRPQWLNKWVRDPGKLVPGTRMPGYYPEPNSGPKDVLDGDDERQIQAIVDYLMTIGKPEALMRGESEPAKPSPESQPTPATGEVKDKAGAGNQASL
ncbi:MAG TPA: c-type cytochrome, partial [bacterium]|nr:c-type cytochrome [bacterium]